MKPRKSDKMILEDKSAGRVFEFRPWVRSSSKRRNFRILAAVMAGFLVFLVVSTASGQEWRFYGGDAGGTRFSPLRQINRDNVGRLKRAWTYHIGEVDRGGNETDRHHVAPFESTPLVIDGVLYFSTPSNRVIALDAENGKIGRAHV